MPRNRSDASLNPAPFALPAAPGVARSAAIHLASLAGFGAIAPEEVELLLTTPALNSTQVPNGETLHVVIESSTDGSFSSIVALLDLTFTGAGGNGVAAQSIRVRPGDAQYVRATLTTSSGAGDCSSVSATLSPRF